MLTIFTCGGDSDAATAAFLIFWVAGPNLITGSGSRRSAAFLFQQWMGHFP